MSNLNDNAVKSISDMKLQVSKLERYIARASSKRQAYEKKLERQYTINKATQNLVRQGIALMKRPSSRLGVDL